MDELDIDMEELESRLYSQVYHSSAEDQGLPERQEPPSNPNHRVKRPSRYFELPKAKPVEKTPQFIPLAANEPRAFNAPQYQGREVFESRYFNGVSTIPDQLIRMIAPCNNIVVLPQAPTQIIAKDVLPTTRNKNYEKYAAREQMRQLKRAKKNEKNKRRRQMKRNLKKAELQAQTLNTSGSFLEHNLVVKPVTLDPFKSDVITLSDSDESDCMEIPEKRELVVLSSDDESPLNIKKENDKDLKTNKSTVNIKADPSISGLKNDDDVIFVEPEPKQIEIIEIDCDSVNTKHVDDEKHSETASTNSDNLKIPNIPHRSKRPCQRSRGSRTPDSSASNDFLDSTVDLNQSKFNFSLHGPDFGNTNVLKTKGVAISETDSTTSDVVSMKTNFFNVVDFETTSKQFFEDANLESFGKYITPSRDNVKPVEQTDFEEICTRASQRHNISTHDSSGSSSESDYDEDKVSYLNSKRLPQLSTVHIETELVDKDDSLAAEEIHVEPKQMPEKNDAKRKLEDDDTSNKKRKVSDVADQKEEVAIVANVKEQEAARFDDDIDIGDHSDFIIVDETGDDDDDDNSKNDSDNTESYFSCDDFNNITSDLTLGNCHGEEQGKGDASITRNNSKDDTDYMNFSVEEIHRTMSDDPDLWKILDVDRLHFRYATPKGPRCHRCREVGHMALHCTNKQGPPACTLCGERTHAEPRCPRAMCTSCARVGGHTTYCSRCARWRNIQCNICKLYGHIDTVCPDVWRRYHLTTKPGPIVKPAVQALKAEKDRWCSGCAQSGHFESACVHYNRTHFAVYPEVLHYVDLYNFPKYQPYIILQEDISTKNSKTADDANVIDTDTEDQTAQEDSFHDAETGSPDKTGFDASDSSRENEMYFKVNFPPPNFIPLYFRNQMAYLKKQYLHSCKRSQNKNSNQSVSGTDCLKDVPSCSLKSGTSASLDEFISLDSKVDDNSRDMKENTYSGYAMQPKRSAYNQTLRLAQLEFAYIHSKHGMFFFDDIGRKSGVHLSIDRYDDRPTGIVYMSGQSEGNILNVKKEILHFVHNMPFVTNLPRDSKDMLDFLLRHKEMLDKAEGNCWTLCKKLCKITHVASRAGYSPETAKLKADMQVTIQLLLFGKLKLEQGGEHLNNIQDWIRMMKNEPNYELSYKDLFEIHHSYAYLFEARKSIFPFKNLCAKHDHYILPAGDNFKRRKMPQRNRMYVENKSKFVMDTCKKYNLPNKFLTELIALQNAMQASKYSRICYVDFLRFMSRFRTYLKKQKIL